MSVKYIKTLASAAVPPVLEALVLSFAVGLPMLPFSHCLFSSYRPVFYVVLYNHSLEYIYNCELQKKISLKSNSLTSIIIKRYINVVYIRNVIR